MISQIFDNGAFKVLALFALSPGSKFRRKEMKEKIKINNVPLDRALSRLVSTGIIKKEKGLYFVNFENPYAEQIVSLVSLHHKRLKNLPLDVYLLLADVVDELSITKNIEVWLFGSYSKIVYSEKSDIDIALLLPPGFSKMCIRKIFKKLEKRYSKEIEGHFFEAHSFYRNKNDPLVKEILQNGVRLI
ncbi:MAG: nucleotidyltransferase domain-containing protein [Candidatus Aenigmarchaeota archaeon]|nr:nucleotidyltransferase domain-containing protein [Candidatus Aenigmarchaeota archaeon]